MKITAATPEVEKYKIYDCNGSTIPYVVSFDTENCEIELAIQVSKPEEDVTESKALFLHELDNDGKAREVFLSFKIPGAYATYDGMIIAQSN